ncbi:MULTISPECIES: trans-sulfuration enzyme family protein [Streptomycetaceae]|uniref:homocysteine desulfhydrase n=1 Tax=Streptantibioticus cattleyicolor (strain ATCC 35852 / DSM 46488 / JCM 4925 / NBRC 14057 / NRRL 8057) TaxID=1003195 RepID=F8JW15_STREN|nr:MULTISPECIES: PLP-dependent aspartate aminotransferase family protein [Streptomycetaceae]AEW93185.1 Cystathionine gamma-synthase [Streptantibioticus cattleyicolor NRRL 8057 = DSM 46488]MYS57910.1 PLP-dependent transferase [Streptomyces sp. SID5468]CCB73546.1 Cystathionine gamma-synthase [Streptantibioticus cattleyicolor NRRL 8057 = DSM 46488]
MTSAVPLRTTTATADAPHRTDTAAVHAGRRDLRQLGVHVPPLEMSTTNPLPCVERGGASYEALAGGGLPPGDGSHVYQRLWNPTTARFEEAVAELEGCAQAVAFSSGMAAITACLLAARSCGKGHVVGVRPLYGGTDHVLASGLLGTEVSWARPERVAEALRPDTGLVIVETPGNPTLELVDIAAVADRCGDVPLLVDNTFATPVLQRPAEHGATLVVHSATKYLGGHGDVLAGVVATDEEWATRLRPVRALTGGVLHPLAGYLLHRGVQTLPLRVRHQSASARRLATWLTGHPAVERVYYPGLPQCDPAGLVGRQMSGPGAVVAFTVRGGGAAAAATADACELITHAVSLGGVDTLIQHPASLTHRPVTPDARPDAAVLRLSVGLEDPADLCEDLDRALRAAGRA